MVELKLVMVTMMMFFFVLLMKVVYPGKVTAKYSSMDEALSALDKGIANWCKKIGIDLIDVSE